MAAVSGLSCVKSDDKSGNEIVKFCCWNVVVTEAETGFCRKLPDSIIIIVIIVILH